MLSNLLTLLLALISFFLMFIILLQRGRGGGLTGALGGLGGQSAFGTKAGDVFTRITVGVAMVWVLLNCASIFANRSEAARVFSGRGGAEKSADDPVFPTKTQFPKEDGADSAIDPETPEGTVPADGAAEKKSAVKGDPEKSDAETVKEKAAGDAAKPAATDKPTAKPAAAETPAATEKPATPEKPAATPEKPAASEKPAATEGAKPAKEPAPTEKPEAGAATPEKPKAE